MTTPDTPDTPPAEKPAAVAVFEFAHPALRLPGACFTLKPGSMEAVMQVPLGDSAGTVPLRQVQATFGIAGDSPDGMMLRRVEAALRHVRLIRHGDRIPTEIVDGTASWAVDPRHVEMAAMRIAGPLFRSLGRGSLAALDAGGADAAEVTKRQVRDVAGEIAARCGIAPEAKLEVVDRIELLIAEMAFIEGLRDFYKPVFDMPRKLREIGRRNSRDRDFADQLKSTQSLLKPPLGRLQAALDEADRQVADPFSAVTHHAKTIRTLRQLRDMLHFETLRWEELPGRWQHLRTDRDEAAFEAVRLNRFASMNFYSVKSWAGAG